MPFLDDDFIDMRCDDGSVWHFYWGDEVERVSSDAAGHRIRAIGHGGRVVREGLVKPSAKFRDTALLRLSMIDVQQGDGLILETPGRKTIFIDGGEGKAARSRGFPTPNKLWEGKSCLPDDEPCAAQRTRGPP